MECKCSLPRGRKIRSNRFRALPIILSLISIILRRVRPGKAMLAHLSGHTTLDYIMKRIFKSQFEEISTNLQFFFLWSSACIQMWTWLGGPAQVLFELLSLLYRKMSDETVYGHANFPLPDVCPPEDFQIKKKKINGRDQPTYAQNNDFIPIPSPLYAHVRIFSPLPLCVRMIFRTKQVPISLITRCIILSWRIWVTNFMELLLACWNVRIFTFCIYCEQLHVVRKWLASAR